MNEQPCDCGNFPSRVSELAGIARRFHYWVGASGTDYMHSVFRLEAFPEIYGAVYVAVRRASRSRCEAVAIGQVLPVVGLSVHSALLRRLARRGADEIHLHLLARTPAETAAIVRDLRRRHDARQPVAA